MKHASTLKMVALMTLFVALMSISGASNASAAPTPRTTCADGSYSSSTGSGTCSWHGGIAGGGLSGSGNWSDNFPVTLCNDGTYSSSTGSGTCSWHGGIAGNYTVPAAPQQSYAWASNRFASPSGKLQCRYEPQKKRLGCSSSDTGQSAWVSRRVYAYWQYSVIPGRSVYVLQYGSTWRGGGFRCISRKDGMECHPPNGTDYFVINRSGAFTYR